MIKTQVYNLSKKKLVIENLAKPNSIFGNMLGLMFKKSEDVNFDGLYLSPCNSIHTFFCHFDLDVYFLNSDQKVIRIIKSLAPWRMTRNYFSARSVIETKAGVTEDIELGDKLEVTCIN